MRANWYASGELNGQTAGFLYSLIGGGDRKSTVDPAGAGIAIWNGYNMNALNGHVDYLNRIPLTAANLDPNQWPNVITLTHSATDEPATIGDAVTLQFRYQSYGWPADVDIFLDNDQNPYNGNAGVCLSPVHLGATGTDIIKTNVTWNTTGFTAGTYYLYARVRSVPQAPYGISTRYLYAPQRIVLGNPGGGGGTLLDAPTLLTPANGATGKSTTPTFTWSAVNGATSYRIMVAATSNALPTDPTVGTCPTCLLNDTTTDTSYLLNSIVLNAGTNYYWKVHARSPNYYGNWPSQSSFTTASAITWTGAAGSEWSNTNNWSPKVVPTSSDNVIVNSGTVNVPTNFVFQSLTFTGGTLNNSFTIGGTMNWTGGALSDTGILTIQGGGVLNIVGTDDSKSLMRTINNTGTINFLGPGYLESESPSATINNLASGVFNQLSDASINDTSDSLLTINNAGTFVKSGGTGVSTFYKVAFNNTGIAQFNSGGVMEFEDAVFSNTGSVNVQSGELLFTQATTIGAATPLNAAPGASVGFAVSSSLESITLTTNLTVNGTMNWYYGTISGPGTMNVATGSVLNMTSDSTKYLDTTINNAGTMIFGGTGYIEASTGATINNLAGGVFNHQSDASINYYSYDPTLTINNAGTYLKSGGTGTSVFQNVSFSNSGSMQFNGGAVMKFHDAIFNSTGSVNVQSGELLFSETTAIRAITPLNAAPGASVGFAVAYSYDTITLTTNLTVNGPVNWHYGTISGPGALNVAAGSVLNLTSDSTKYLKTTINNAGTMLFGGTGYLDAGSASAVINNLAGGVFNHQSDASINRYSYNPYLTLNNAGTYLKSGGTGTSTFYKVTFNNTGVVEVLSGILNLNNGFNQPAGDTRLAGGSLSGSTFNFTGGTLSGSGTINAAVVNGAVVSPGSSPGTLTINGNYTQTATGVLQMELGGLTPGTGFDQLVVNGQAALAGTLNVTLLNGFTPVLSNTFRLLTYVSRTGAFAQTNGLNIGYGHHFRPDFTSTNLTLTVIGGGPPTLSPVGRTNGLFGLHWQGEASAAYRLEASTNLANWLPLFTTNTPDGMFDFVDPESAVLPQRFYRVVSP